MTIPTGRMLPLSLLVLSTLLLAGVPGQPLPAPPAAPTIKAQAPEPTFPIPWHALLRQQLPDGEPLLLEPEEPLLDLTDPEQLAAVLHRRGETIPGLYESLPSDQRGDLVASLNSARMLRQHLVELLTWEPRSELRALLLECTDPADFARPEILPPDYELIALLELPTVTPIGAEEWVARMELASRIDPDLGAQWVRDARRAYPESPLVAFTASLITLVDGAASHTYEVAERMESARALARLLNGSGARQWSAESRIRAYYAMYFSPEPDRVIAFYEARIRVEPDPRARDTLGLLLSRLGQRTSPP